MDELNNEGLKDMQAAQMPTGIEGMDVGGSVDPAIIDHISGYAPFLEPVAAFMNDGGVFMWIIFWMWIFGMALAVERLKSYASFNIDAKSFMALIKSYVVNNNVEQALATCVNTKALLPAVVKGGLMRANQTKEQILDAMESVTIEAAMKVETRLSYLALSANIATLLGLLGTIYGLIQSFAAVAQADPGMKAKLLAMGISKAMNTTALGIIASITLMVVHSFLVNKSEKILGEIGLYSASLVDLLGARKVEEK